MDLKGCCHLRHRGSHGKHAEGFEGDSENEGVVRGEEVGGREMLKVRTEL